MQGWLHVRIIAPPLCHINDKWRPMCSLALSLFKWTHWDIICDTPYLWQSIYGSLHIAIFFYIEHWVEQFCTFIRSDQRTKILEISKQNCLDTEQRQTQYFGPSSPRSITFNATKDPFFALCVGFEALHSWLYIISLFSGLFSVVGCGCVVSTGWELHQLWLRLHTNYVLLIPTNYIPGNSQNLEK